MLIKNLIIILTTSCIRNNKSTYIIREAQLCVPDFSDGMDGYFFGPCDKIVECERILLKCRFAENRSRYCFSRDAHLCSFQKNGNYSGYYQVECG